MMYLYFLLTYVLYNDSVYDQLCILRPCIKMWKEKVRQVNEND